MLMLFAGAFFVILAGIVLLLVVREEQKGFGALAGERIYQDTKERPGRNLYAKTLNLVGKPDYLVKEHGVVIPVEVKTGKTPRSPYENHKMQLWAYCLLVEENYATPPLFGYLLYPENDFQIPYTKREREKVEKVVAEITACKLAHKELHCQHKAHYLLESG
jgi:CRISPR-associated exonuclease Cas4